MRMLKVVQTITLSAVFVAFGFRNTDAQQARIPKVGWLSARSSSEMGSKSFWREFKTLGYIDGRNVAFEYRYADDDPDRLPTLANELVQLKVNVLLTPSSRAALALQNATRTIPIIFFNVPDPVQEGLITSLAQPGENITGFATTSSLLTSKRFGLLNETIPKLSRIAVLWDPTNPSSELAWKESQLAAKELRLQLFSLAVSNADKYESGFKEASKAHVAALAVTLHGLANSNQKKITDLAATYHLPAIYPRRDYVETGGLMSYAADQREPYQRAAVYVDKILKGTKPADLPVEQPKKFELVINLKTAKQIGLTIPPNVLARADKVIR